MELLARVTLVFAGTIAYLGLAVRGWGGIGPFFAHPAPTALTVALFLRALPP
jgi:hypothetical protein